MAAMKALALAYLMVTLIGILWVVLVVGPALASAGLSGALPGDPTTPDRNESQGGFGFAIPGINFLDWRFTATVLVAILAGVIGVAILTHVLPTLAGAAGPISAIAWLVIIGGGTIVGAMALVPVFSVLPNGSGDLVSGVYVIAGLLLTTGSTLEALGGD